MEDTVKDTIRTRRIAILAAEGYDHDQLMTVKNALEGAGAVTEIVSKFLGALASNNSASVAVDKTYVTTASVMYDAVFVPGGSDSIETLKTQGDALHFVNEAFKHCKPIAATGDGVMLLQAADLPDLHVAGPQSEDEMVSHRGVVTSQDGMDLEAFSQAFVDAIAQHRHWDRQTRERVPA
jgi:catalase